MSSPSSFLFMCVGCPSPPSLHPLTLSVYLCLSRWVCPPYLHLCTTFHPPCLLPEAPQAPPWRLPGAQVGVGDEAVCGDGFLGQEEACASPERGAILSQSHRALALGSGEQLTKLSQHCVARTQRWTERGRTRAWLAWSLPQPMQALVA